MRARVLLPAALAAFVLAALAGRVTSTSAEGPDASAPSPSTVAVEDDAVRAAQSVVRRLGSRDMYDERSRLDLLAASLSPALFASTERAYLLVGETLGLRADGTSGDGALVARLVPVGHRVLQRRPDEVVVAVWTVGLLGVAGPTSPKPVQATWSTETLTMRRQAGRWVCTRLVHEDGPAPVAGAQVPAAPSLLLEQDRRFEDSP